MAEILVLNRTDLPTDATIYQRGDPVVIFPDGHNWGAEELNSAKFIIVKIAGVAPETLKAYLARVEEIIGVSPSGIKRTRTIHKCRYRLPVESLPPRHRNKQQIAVSLTEWTSMIVDKTL